MSGEFNPDLPDQHPADHNFLRQHWAGELQKTLRKLPSAPNKGSYYRMIRVQFFFFHGATDSEERGDYPPLQIREFIPRLKTLKDELEINDEGDRPEQPDTAISDDTLEELQELLDEYQAALLN